MKVQSCCGAGGEEQKALIAESAGAVGDTTKHAIKYHIVQSPQPNARALQQRGCCQLLRVKPEQLQPVRGRNGVDVDGGQRVHNPNKAGLVTDTARSPRHRDHAIDRGGQVSRQACQDTAQAVARDSTMAGRA